MKSSIFLSFFDIDNDETKKEYKFVCNLLRCVLLQYDRVYILDGTKKILNIVTKYIKCPVNYAETNKNCDLTNNGIVFIKAISPNINHYSIRFVSDPNQKYNFRKYKTYGAHVDYYYNTERLCDLIVTELFTELSDMYQVFEKNAVLQDCSIIVFDLDDTLIDEKYNLLSPKMPKILGITKNIFDYVLLWSHGDACHVRHSLLTNKLHENMFDMIITRGTLQKDWYNKGLGYLLKEANRTLKIGSLSFSVLADDLLSNWIGDYDCFVLIPQKTTGDKLAQFYLDKLTELKSYVWYKQPIKNRILSIC